MDIKTNRLFNKKPQETKQSSKKIQEYYNQSNNQSAQQKKINSDTISVEKKIETTNNNSSVDLSNNTDSVYRASNDQHIIKAVKPKRQVRKKGAPFKNHDSIFRIKKSVKISAYLDIILKNLIEKYATGRTKDDILTEALLEYIEKRYSNEDKEDMFRDINNEVKILREEKGVVIEHDIDGNVIKSREDIEREFEERLRKSLRLKD